MGDPSATDDPQRDTRRNVEINLGKSCNSRCVFCLDGQATRAEAAFTPWEELRAELERWRAEGYLSVGFLGGEPTVYPHLTRAVAAAAALGYTRITLATNAMRLAQDSFVTELVDAGLTRVTISMHAHTAALEDGLTTVAGSFAKKCQAIEHLQQHRARGALRDGVSVNAVLSRVNYPHLPRMLRFFFEQLGLDDLRVNFIRPEGNAAHDAELTPPYTAVVPVLVKAILLNEYHFKKVFTFGGIPLCMLPAELLTSRHLLRKVAGDLYRDLATACSIRSEGYDDGVSQVEGGRARFNWQDRKRHDLKHTLETCRECVMNETCEGVWRTYLEIYGGEELSALRHVAGELRREHPLPTDPPRPRCSAGGVIGRRSS